MELDIKVAFNISPFSLINLAFLHNLLMLCLFPRFAVLRCRVYVVLLLLALFDVLHYIKIHGIIFIY